MKTKLIWIPIIALAMISGALGANVTDVELSSQDGGFLAKIAVDGQPRYIHQVEKPKDGHPYRVIIDLLKATHELGQKNFDKLPKSPIMRIRSSQYSVTPERSCPFMMATLMT